MATARTRIVRIRVTAPDAATLHRVVAESELDAACGGAKRDERGVASIDAYAARDQIARLEAQGVTVEVLDADALATARARQREVGQGNRFEGQNRVPRGLGKKIQGNVG